MGKGLELQERAEKRRKTHLSTKATPSVDARRGRNKLKKSLKIIRQIPGSQRRLRGNADTYDPDDASACDDEVVIRRVGTRKKRNTGPWSMVNDGPGQREHSHAYACRTASTFVGNAAAAAYRRRMLAVVIP